VRRVRAGPRRGWQGDKVVTLAGGDKVVTLAWLVDWLTARRAAPHPVRAAPCAVRITRRAPRVRSAPREHGLGPSTLNLNLR